MLFICYPKNIGKYDYGPYNKYKSVLNDSDDIIPGMLRYVNIHMICMLVNVAGIVNRDLYNLLI